MAGETKQRPDKSLFERFMLVFAVVEPIATIPQIYQVWSNRSVAGVSLPTWVFYTLTSGIWLLYGIKIKDKPIVASGFLWMATQALVVIGIVVRTGR
jgi:uncharacterized protein with PQ loop repeat